MNRRRLRRPVTALILTGVVVPAICWILLGMPPLQALLVGAVAVIVGALVCFPPDGLDVSFPEPPTPVRDRGARREAFRLSWNVAGSNNRVGSTLITRLQQIAGSRLADRGLRLGDPADGDRVTELVGRRAYRLLTLTPGADAPSHDFILALAAVERLPETETAMRHQPVQTVTSGTSPEADKEIG